MILRSTIAAREAFAQSATGSVREAGEAAASPSVRFWGAGENDHCLLPCDGCGGIGVELTIFFGTAQIAEAVCRLHGVQRPGADFAGVGNGSEAEL